MGDREIVLAPRQLIQRGHAIDLFVQVRSAERHAGATMTLVVSRHVGERRQAEEVISIGFPIRLGVGITSIDREIAAERLTGDRYLLQVVVTTPDGLLAERSAFMELMYNLPTREP